MAELDMGLNAQLQLESGIVTAWTQDEGHHQAA
jgi:hypothetical protein